MHIKIETSNISLQRPADGVRTRLPCLDCLFWYRCKQGGMIDCELKQA